MRSAQSFSRRFREARLNLFFSLLESEPGIITILDVGGTARFWHDFRDRPELARAEVTLLNLPDSSENQQWSIDARNGPFRLVAGDARDMSQFEDELFDVVFSNSVIEHVGTYSDQRCAANEMRRVGRRFFVQTPNRFFPIEPHVHVPMFQFLPRAAKIGLHRRYKMGWSERAKTWLEAAAMVDSIRLLSEGEFRDLFPGARVYRERFAGMTKSLVAYGGWRARLGRDSISRARQ